MVKKSYLDIAFVLALFYVYSNDGVKTLQEYDRRTRIMYLKDYVKPAWFGVLYQNYIYIPW